MCSGAVQHTAGVRAGVSQETLLLQFPSFALVQVVTYPGTSSAPQVLSLYMLFFACFILIQAVLHKFNPGTSFAPQVVLDKFTTSYCIQAHATRAPQW